MADEIKIRSIEPEEYPLLEDFLYDAIYFPEGAAAPPREIVNQPELDMGIWMNIRRNYAYRMYQKLGFQVIREQDDDYLMVLELQG